MAARRYEISLLVFKREYAADQTMPEVANTPSPKLYLTAANNEKNSPFYD